MLSRSAVSAAGYFFLVSKRLSTTFGGFLRKASTKVYHIRKKQHQQFKRILAAVDRLTVFDALSDRDLRALAASIDSRDVKKATLLYRRNDPPDNLYIVA